MVPNVFGTTEIADSLTKPIRLPANAKLCSRARLAAGSAFGGLIDAGLVSSTAITPAWQWSPALLMQKSVAGVSTRSVNKEDREKGAVSTTETNTQITWNGR
jgi:hypothetical protein